MRDDLEGAGAGSGALAVVVFFIHPGSAALALVVRSLASIFGNFLQSAKVTLKK